MFLKSNKSFKYYMTYAPDLNSPSLLVKLNHYNLMTKNCPAKNVYRKEKKTENVSEFCYLDHIISNKDEVPFTESSTASAIGDQMSYQVYYTIVT